MLTLRSTFTLTTKRHPPVSARHQPHSGALPFLPKPWNVVRREVILNDQDLVARGKSQALGHGQKSL